jgi:hypothetical protein
MLACPDVDTLREHWFRPPPAQGEGRPAPSGLLPGAMDRWVHLRLAEGVPTFLVPVSAILFRGESLEIATVGEGGPARLSAIVPGRDFGNEIEVLGGPATGQQPTGLAGRRPGGAHRGAAPAHGRVRNGELRHPTGRVGNRCGMSCRNRQQTRQKERGDLFPKICHALCTDSSGKMSGDLPGDSPPASRSLEESSRWRRTRLK